MCSIIYITFCIDICCSDTYHYIISLYHTLYYITLPYIMSLYGMIIPYQQIPLLYHLSSYWHITIPWYYIGHIIPYHTVRLLYYNTIYSIVTVCLTIFLAGFPIAPHALLRLPCLCQASGEVAPAQGKRVKANGTDIGNML